MSGCCPEALSELTINLGNLISLNSFKKCIWSIAYFLGHKKPEIVLTTNKDISEVVSILENFKTRIKWTIIKTNDLNIDDIKAFELCNKFCNEHTLKISSNSFFYKDILLDNPISFKSYLLPRYVQEGVEEYGQNMCDFYAKECFKYPLENEFYFINKSDQFSDTNIFCVEEEIEKENNYTEITVDEILQSSTIKRS